MQRSEYVVWAVLLPAAVWLSSRADAAVRTVRHSDGAVKVRFEVDEDGQRHGSYESFAPDGKPRTRATYRRGKLHGRRSIRRDTKLVRDELWIGGRLLLPKSAEIIQRELAAIRTAAVETVGETPVASPKVVAAVRDVSAQRRREAALRRLMAYRFLCDVPYQDLVLDRAFNAYAEAAADIMARLVRMTHEPTNPGLPEHEYEFARRGTRSSNLYWFSGPNDDLPARAVAAFMDDSDKRNIARLGHRRWCLDPQMQRTGFGNQGKFAAMWVFDRSRKTAPEYDFIAFPPRGLCPASLVKPRFAWSVSLNPRMYTKPQRERVQVQVYPAQLDTERLRLEIAPEPLSLDFLAVDRRGFGVDNCIIFRPTGVEIAPHVTYDVHITGLNRRDGSAATVKYLVRFAEN